MCQIQIVKRINKKLTKKDNKEFIKLMFLGNQYNYDAFGVFNHNYSVKAPGDFDYQLINERKVMKNKFIVGHNRLATSGECMDYSQDSQEDVIINPFFMGHWALSLLGRIGYWWKSLGEKPILKNQNNHPFKINEFSLVHNGIIHNYKKLKKKYKIQSEVETDSYIILYLINHFFSESKKEDRVDKIIDAIKKTTKKICGNYSVILYDKRGSNIFYFRNDCVSFTFNIIGKDLIVGSTNERNLNFIYEKKKSRKRIHTYPGEIYLVGDEIKKVGEFQDV